MPFRRPRSRARHLAAGRNPKLGYDNFDRELTDAQRAAYLTDGRDPCATADAGRRPQLGRPGARYHTFAAAQCQISH